MKRINTYMKSVVLAVLLALTGSIYAAPLEKDGIYYTRNSIGGFVTVTYNKMDGTDYSGRLVIPETVMFDGKTYPVRYIATNAFYRCKDLVSVSIPDCVESIGQFAFYGCTGLTEVNIPSSLKLIAAYCFQNCSSLKTVSGLSASTTIDYIGDYAFENCSQLSSVTIPSKVTSIGNCAYNNAAKSVREISLPSSLVSIGEKAFGGIEISSLYIPASVQNIGDGAFYTGACTSVTVDPANVAFDSRGGCNAVIGKWTNNLVFGSNYTVIPDGVESISPSAFAYCSKLTSITIPSSVKSIGEGAFLYCTGLRDVVINGAITTLAKSTFAMCNLSSLVLPASLKNIYESSVSCVAEEMVFPENVTYIASGSCSFRNYVTKVTFPSSLQYVGAKAFTFNSSVGEIYCEGDVPGYTDPDAFGSLDLRNVTLKVNKNYYSNYRNTAPWSYFGNIVQYAGDDEIKDVASVSLTDGEVYSSTEYRRAETLTYTRKFGQTKWQALYVPFSMSYDDWKEDFVVARINAIRMYDTDNDDEFDETEIELVKVNAGTLYPNHPYFIKALTAGNKVITLHDAMVYPAVEDSVTCSTTEQGYAFKGTYSGVTGDEMVANRYYALSGGQLCYTLNTSAFLSPNRWYLEVTDRGSQIMSDKPAAARIRISIDGEDITDDDDVTSILGFDGAYEQGRGENLRIYSIEGHLVNADGDRTSLSPGCYIQNGKKFMIF